MIYYINRPFFSVFGPTFMNLNQIFSIKLHSKGLKSPIFVCLKSLRVGMTIFKKIHFLTPSFIETPYIVIRPTVPCSFSICAQTFSWYQNLIRLHVLLNGITLIRIVDSTGSTIANCATLIWWLLHKQILKKRNAAEKF